MRTFVGTYNVKTQYTINKFLGIASTKNVKYKFAESNIKEDTIICYLTIIANNRLQLRKFKKEGLRTLKKLGKVELVIGVG